MKKRLLSLALCLALCLGLFPFGVLAANEATDTSDSEATTAVAELTQTGTDGKTVKTEYDTLQAALNAAGHKYFAGNSSGTVQSAEVTLLRDVTEMVSVENVSVPSLILNLNAQTLSGTSRNSEYNINYVLKMNCTYGSLSIKNGTIENKANLSNHRSIAVSTGKVILENVTVTGTGNTYSVDVTGGGNLEVQGDCTFNGPVYVKGGGSAKLSGGVYNNGICLQSKADTYYAEMLETGYIFVDKDKNYIEASSLNANSIQPLEVVACNHRDSDSKSTFGDNYVCTRCKYECKHSGEFNTDGTCKTCLKPFVAQVGNKAFTQDKISDAFSEAATTGNTLKLLANYTGYDTPTATGTWTFDLNGHTMRPFNIGQTADGANGTTAIPGNLTITGSGTAYSTEVKNGMLTVSDNDVTIQGLSIASGGNAVLSGGIYTVGSTLASVKMDDSSKKVYQLLASGYAFQSTAEGGGIVDGYVQDLKESVKVVEHKKHNVINGKCACGLTCDHVEKWENGVCSNCGYACPHPTVTESNYIYTCSTCKQEMGAEIGDGNKYYTTIEAAIAAAVSGDTITMLKDVSNSVSFIDSIKKRTLTLNLNNKSIGGFLYVLYGEKLTLTGGGNIYRIQLNSNSELNLSTWTGSVTSYLTVESTSKLTIGNKIGNIEQLLLNNSSASVQISGGKFHTIKGNNIKPSQFLDTGYALWGTCNTISLIPGYVGYDTSFNEIHDAEVRLCTAHVDENADNLCDYCNTDLSSAAVATLTVGGTTYYYTDLPSAFAKANTDGGTITLQKNVENLTEALAIDNTNLRVPVDITLDLNGKTLSGASDPGSSLLSVSTFGSVTIRDSGTSGLIKNTNPGNYAVYVSAGKLIIEAGSFVGTDSQEAIPTPGYALGVRAATLNITGGTFTGHVTVQYSNVNISGGTFTSLLTYDNTAIGSLLADGYAFKSSGDSGTWLTQQQLTQTAATNVTAVEAPIKSLTLTSDAANNTVEYGNTVKLTANCTTAEGYNQLTLKWYKIDGSAETALTEANGAHAELKDLSIGKHKYRVTATSTDGYSKSAEITVTVTKANIKEFTRPTAKSLTYTSQPQELVTAGMAEGGAMQYALAQDGGYTADIPTGTEASSYTVWYKVAGDSNHNDTEPASITVTISKANPTYELPANLTATYGQTLASVNLPTGWSWADGDQSVGEVGTHSFKATYTPNDTANYNTLTDLTLSVTVNKADGNVTAPTAKENLVYTGEAQDLLATAATSETGTVKYSLDGEAFTTDLPKATNAGTYKVYYKVFGDSNHEDTAVASMEIKIAQAKVTVKALDKSVYVGSTAPDLSKPVKDTDYTVTGLLGADELGGTLKLEYAETPDMSKAGSVAINISGITVDENYTLELLPGTLTITTRPSSGGSGSSGTKTDTVKNPDGSTTTVTKADGSKTETTTASTAGGSTGSTVTKTDAQGSSKTEASAKLSEKDVKNAQETGGAVAVPVKDIAAAKDANAATEVKIDLPKNAGKTTVEIPVDKVTSGTVAVIVHEDGTEEIVKDSKPTEDGVQLELDGSTTVKIIDNSKDFIDTRDHWSREEVNFVAARELFNGVGGNRFGVSEAMTRGMVNTVLARLSGVDTTPGQGQTWYAVGTAWAVKNGISDGTNPTGNVTREQLATLLYRYAGSPDVSGNLSFADAASVSDYAKNALLWANQNGIVNGVGSNTIAPKANAERAQVAAMFARYLQNQ